MSLLDSVFGSMCLSVLLLHVRVYVIMFVLFVYVCVLCSRLFHRITLLYYSSCSALVCCLSDYVIVMLLCVHVRACVLVLFGVRACVRVSRCRGCIGFLNVFKCFAVNVMLLFSNLR